MPSLKKNTDPFLSYCEHKEISTAVEVAAPESSISPIFVWRYNKFILGALNTKLNLFKKINRFSMDKFNI